MPASWHRQEQRLRFRWLSTGTIIWAIINLITSTFQGLVGAVFEGVGVSLGSFVAGMLFNNIGGSATFRLFATGALVFLVVHVIIQKVYARFAGSIGKAGEDVMSRNDLAKQVVYIAGGTDIIHMSTETGPHDDKSSTGSGAGASRVLLSEEAGFREISLNK